MHEQLINHLFKRLIRAFLFLTYKMCTTLNLKITREDSPFLGNNKPHYKSLSVKHLTWELVQTTRLTSLFHTYHLNQLRGYMIITYNYSCWGTLSTRILWSRPLKYTINKHHDHIRWSTPSTKFNNHKHRDH